MRTRSETGRVLGTPGGSLSNPDWLGASARGAARVGQAGEVRTAAVLDEFARGGSVTVLHDLMTPSKKYKANIDHVVVSGSTVYPIDSKVWKPGRYWTWGGRTRRGWERFTPAEKKTMVVITQALEAYLAARGVNAVVAEPLLFVWPSSKHSSLRTGLLTVPGARVVPGPRVQGTVSKLFGNRLRGGGQAADERVVDALVPLLNRPGPSVFG